MPNEIHLVISDGRRPGQWAMRVTEPFHPLSEDAIYRALDTLHLRGVLHYADGSTREFVPDLPGRVLDRVYPPASGGEAK